MECVGTRQLTVKPDGARLGLTELGAVRTLVSSGVARAWTRACSDRRSNLDTRDDIAPLIRPTVLERDAVTVLMQFPMIHRLKKHIGELRMADPASSRRATTSRASMRFAEMFSDIPQGSQHRHPGGPVKVVDHYGSVIALEETKRSTWLRMHHPAGHNLFQVHDPFPGLLGVADLPPSRRRPAGAVYDQPAPQAASSGTWTRLPMCGLGAVGSKPIGLDGTIIPGAPPGRPDQLSGRSACASKVLQRCVHGAAYPRFETESSPHPKGLQCEHSHIRIEACPARGSPVNQSAPSSRPSKPVRAAIVPYAVRSGAHCGPAR